MQVKLRYGKRCRCRIRGLNKLQLTQKNQKIKTELKTKAHHQSLSQPYSRICLGTSKVNSNDLDSTTPTTAVPRIVLNTKLNSTPDNAQNVLWESALHQDHLALRLDDLNCAARTHPQEVA